MQTAPMQEREQQPGFGLILRFMPDASVAEQDEAYQNLLRFGRMLLKWLETEGPKLQAANKIVATKNSVPT